MNEPHSLDVVTNHLTEAEAFRLNSLKLDPLAQPRFDPLRSCLRWADEEPQGISGKEYEHLLDLLIARSIIHKGRTRDEWYAITPTSYFVDLWDEALKRAPNWPGFARTSLPSTDRTFLDGELAKPLEKHL